MNRILRTLAGRVLVAVSALSFVGGANAQSLEVDIDPVTINGTLSFGSDPIDSASIYACSNTCVGTSLNAAGSYSLSVSASAGTTSSYFVYAYVYSGNAYYQY